MFSSRDAGAFGAQGRGLVVLAGLLAGGLLAGGLAAAEPARPAADRYPGIGRTATPQELAAWDIDVRPDFKGLPPGRGSALDGQAVWEAQCASCHGVFGENNQVFAPLVGGTGPQDIATGRVARLDDPGFPGRTTLMKLGTVSTLWDYIRRAMPWNAPKSLSTEQVYAVTAYLLHLGGIVPDDYVLSDASMAEVQRRLPNRNGFTTAHGLWPGRSAVPGAGTGGATPAGRPDVQATACMSRCTDTVAIASSLPAHARNNHGNLAQQQREIGPQRGIDTTLAPAGGVAVAAAPKAAPESTAGRGNAALALARSSGCTACHGTDNARIVGPGFGEIARRYAARTDAEAYLAGRIRAGGQGVWGSIPMPAQTLPDGDASRIARWLAAGAGQQQDK